MAELQNTSDITKALNAYQSGQSADGGETPEIVNGYVGAPTYNLYEKVKTGFSPVIQRDYDNQFLEAALSGWGSSRFDMRFGYQAGKDLEDLRANEQSWTGKVTNGLLKGVGTALSTAANSTLGVVAGLLGATGEALKETFDPTNEGLKVGDIITAGVENPVSEFLVNDFRKFTEELLPNYYTEEERTDEYQRQFLKPSHFLSGNFIGDSLLKNFGFTLGAMGGGMVWSKLIGKAAASKLSSDLMKGAVAAAEGDAEAAAYIKEAADIVQRTKSVNGIDWDRVTKNLPEAANALKRTRHSMQLLGATTAAVGEGSAEGLMAKDEFMEEFMPQVQMDFAEAYNSLESNLYNEHPEWFVTTDAYGNPLLQPVLVNQQGIEELHRRQVDLADKYKKTLEYAEKQGDVLAKTVFGLNLPILMGSELIQFGRAFGGDWTTARQNTPKVRGKLGDLKAMSVGELATRGSLKVAATEASEEMLQGAVSSGIQNVAENRLTYFKDLGYDDDAVKKATDGFSFFLQGGIDYLGDTKNWQEGVIGALTGLVGVKIPGMEWSGGIAEAIRTAKSENSAAEKAANKLNELVLSPEFKSRWEDYIRHMAYDEKLNDAVQKNDAYAWHVADSEQLVSDVLAFANAGRMNDFKDFVDGIADITNKDTIQDIKKNILGLDDKTPDEEVVRKVTEQATKMKDVIDSYYSTLNQLKEIAPEDVDTDRFKEMLFTGMQLKAFENLFFKNLNTTLDILQPFFTVRAAMTDEGTPESDSNKVQAQLERLRTEYAKAIASPLSNSSVLDIVPGKTITKILDDTEAELKKITESSSSATQDQRTAVEESLKMMRKLATERRELIQKYGTLRNMTNEKFNEKATSPEKKKKKSDIQQAKVDVSDIGSVDDVKVEVAKRVPGKEQDDYIASLKESRKDNPAVDEYFNIQELKSEINTQSKKTLNNPSVPVREKSLAEFIFDKMFENASSVQQILDMDTSVLPTKEEVLASQCNSVTYSNVDSRVMDSLYDNAIEDVRDIINDVRKDRELSQIFDVAATTSSEKTSAVLSALGVPDGASESQTGQESRRSQAEKQVISDLLGQQQAEKSAKEERAKDLEADFAFDAPKNPDTPNPSSDAKPAAAQDNSNAYSEEPKLLDDSNPVEPDITTPSPVSVHPDKDTEDIQSDAINSNVPQNTIKDTEDPDQSKTDKGQRDNYNMSVPEKSPEATRLRIAAAKEDYGIIASEYTDLPDEVNEQGENTGSIFKKIWDILRDKFNAFNNADKVRIGDKVYFFIDPTLEPYGGEPQILMGVKRGDRVLIYNILRKNADWRGLKELREEIISEYGNWEQTEDQQLFEFSKASRVWARQPGFIQYDISVTADAPINSKVGFDKTAPIITIDENGNYIQLSGNTLQGEVEDYLPEGFKENITRQGRRRGQSRIVGNLYYLARGKDEQYIPIRLNVEHFRPESVKADSYGYNTIHRISGALANLTSKYTKNVNDAIANVNSKTFNTPEERRKAIARAIDTVTDATNKEKIKLITELNKVLDIHGLTVTYGVRKGPQGEYIPTVWFRTYSDTIDDHGNYARGDIDESTKKEFIDGVTGDTIVDYIASLGRSFNVSFPNETQKSKAEVNNHISSMAESGLLTSNARTMRAEGVDIYIDSFNPETRQFDNYHKSKRSSEVSAEQSVANPAPETSAVTDVSELDAGNATSAPASVQDVKNGDFTSLDKEVQRKLIDLGITAEVFNSMSEIQKDGLLQCYG